MLHPCCVRSERRWTGTYDATLLFGVVGKLGGIGSGRWGGKPTVGGGLSLDLNDLLRNGSLKRNATTAGVLTWPRRSGEQVACIGYRATLGSERGALWLRWATADPSTGQEQEREQWIELRSTAQPLGGRRWWFACYNDLVWKLHLPAGASRFASRREHGLGYRSQRQSPRDRAVSRAWKARSRLDAIGDIGGPCFKPKWMRWHTFDRLMAKVERAEAIVNRHAALLVRHGGRRPVITQQRGEGHNDS